MPEGDVDPAIRMSDDAIRAATGRAWVDWRIALDAFDVAANGHAATARHLQQAHGVPAWWAQTLTVRYEQERGLRQPGERADGFGFTVQRTLDARPEDAFAAFASAQALDGWFTSGAEVDFREGGRYRSADGDAGRYLRIEPGRRLRFTWENPKHTPGSVVTVDLIPKGPNRTTVAVSHDRLATRDELDALKPAWRWALGSLARYLATGRGLNA